MQSIGRKIDDTVADEDPSVVPGRVPGVPERAKMCRIMSPGTSEQPRLF